MQRQHGADFEDLERRIGAKDVVDDEHAVLVRDADPDGFLGSLREPLRPDERASAKLTQVEVLARQLQQLGAELVLVAVGVLLDEAVVLERPQEAVHRALRQAEAGRELADAEAAGPSSERLEDTRSSVD